MSSGELAEGAASETVRPDATHWWYPIGTDVGTSILVPGQAPVTPVVAAARVSAKAARDRGKAVLRAANSQNDWAPAARAAADSMSSAVPLYLALLAIARRRDTYP